jgi:AcrR family transcriptional regulator
MFRLLAFRRGEVVSGKPTKRARRNARQERAQETVRIVLEAAAQVLRKRGYVGATTNHIAEKAGVSIGTVYQYFSGKDEIFDTLVKGYFAQVVERVRAEPIDYSRPLRDTLRRLINTGIAAQRHGPELLRALEHVPNAVLRRRLTQGKRDLVTFLCSILEGYRDSLRRLDFERAAALLVDAAEGIGTNDPEAAYDPRLADELTELFARYLEV